MKHFLLTGAIFLYGCKSNQDVDKNCLQVADIITSSECYNQTKGLTLTASNIPASSELNWVISPMKDTLGGTTYLPYTKSTKSSSIVIPDSIINNYPFINVEYVAIKDCGSPLHFRFARRLTDDSTCITWYLKEKNVIGD